MSSQFNEHELVNDEGAFIDTAEHGMDAVIEAQACHLTGAPNAAKLGLSRLEDVLGKPTTKV